MSSPSLRFTLLCTVVTSLSVVAVARAQRAAAELPHLRPESADARALVDALLAQSPTARRLVDHLQQRDVLVYVRLRWFATDAINARIGLVASSGPRRLLIVELGCRRTRQQQLVALGHELRHAVEIADASSVTDVRALAALYRRIGDVVAVGGATEAFETEAAVDAGRQVQREIERR
jgi:hypothetical protein